MAWRDVPGWAVYFSVYEKLKGMGDQWQENEALVESGTSHREYNILWHFLWTLNAGGVAGTLSWLVGIP